MSQMILTLDRSGQPNRWSTWQDVVTYKAKGLISWSLGNIAFTAHGGRNGKTGEQSIVEVPSIIAVNSDVIVKYKTPVLSNRNLFQRDLCKCGYCGRFFRDEKLTRDHIVPTSRGGLDVWTNVVTACKPCNNYKEDYLLEEIDMELLYVPYVPDKNEALILRNRNILDEQLDFLLPFVPKHSRVHKRKLMFENLNN